MIELLTRSDVAKIMGVTPACVRWWADLGQLPVQRTVSGNRLFLMKDVENFRRAREDRRATRVESGAAS